MSSKPLEVWVTITELPMLVEKKSKQTDLNNTPEPMSLPINDLSYDSPYAHFHCQEIWLSDHDSCFKNAIHAIYEKMSV